MIVSILAVAAGALFGGLARWGLSRAPGGAAGTFSANAIGSVVLGVAVGAPGVWPLLLGTGFAGAISTWSTLAKEIGQMVQQRRWAAASLYCAATVLLGLAGALLGLRCAARVFG